MPVLDAGPPDMAHLDAAAIQIPLKNDSPHDRITEHHLGPVPHPSIPYRLGLLLPMTGDYAGIGKAAYAAIQLAIEGADPPIELVLWDTHADPDHTRAGVESLTNDQVGAIVGPIGRRTTHAAAQVADRLAVPLISLSGWPLDVRSPWIFRHRTAYTRQATAIANYALGPMRLKRFAILYPDNDYGRAMAASFWAAVIAGGGQIRAAAPYDESGRDYAKPIRRLIGRLDLGARRRSARWRRINQKSRNRAHHVAPIVDFDALFIPDSAQQIHRLLPHLAYWDLEIKTASDLDAQTLAERYEGHAPKLVQILSASGLNDPQFAEHIGESAHNSVFIDAFHDEDAPDFSAHYAEQTGVPANALVAHAHDAVTWVLPALKLNHRGAILRDLYARPQQEGLFGTAQLQPDGTLRVPLRVLTIRPGEGVVHRDEEENTQYFDDD